MTDSPLMLVKVLLVVGLGAIFVWWQLRDLAQEKKRTDAQKKSQASADGKSGDKPVDDSP